MKADKTQMFSVALAALKPDKPTPFPIYLYLIRNDRMVPIRLEGDSIGKKKYEELVRDHYEELWVPKSHKKEFDAYLEYLAKTGNFPSEPHRSSAQMASDKIDDAAVAGIQAVNAVAHQVENLLATEDFSAESLSALAQELLREMSNIEVAGAAARTNSAAKCKAFADGFLKVTSANESLFEGILAFRSVQEATEHSIFVGSTAAVMAAAIGRADPIWISNLLAASTFHDVGLTHVHANILRKSPSEWTPEERLEYESHVAKGVRLLQDSEDQFPKDVIRMVQEHHEKPDGSGFPFKLKEQEIFEGSRLLILANHFDQLCKGSETDKEISPRAAILQLDIDLPAGKKIAEQLQKMLTAD